MTMTAIVTMTPLATERRGETNVVGLSLFPPGESLINPTIKISIREDRPLSDSLKRLHHMKVLWIASSLV